MSTNNLAGLCRFGVHGKHIVCEVCDKTLPVFPGWDSLHANCRGPSGTSLVVPQMQPVLINDNGLVGTAMKAILSRLGIEPTVGCTCNAFMLKMDAWGIAGCRRNRDEIITHLETNMPNWGWLQSISIAAKAVTSGVAFRLNPLDLCGSLLEASIYDAEEAMNQGDSRFTGSITHNLIMFIYPRRGEQWRRNLRAIVSRLDVFNGKRIFAISTDETTDTKEEVARALRGIECEVFHVHNKIGEVDAFAQLLAKMKSDDPNEITFYCHAKGVTKEGEPGLEAVEKWTDAMYHVLLDNMPAVHRALRTRLFAGAFRHKSGNPFGVGRRKFHNWHFPGTFYWFSSAIYAVDGWDQIDYKYYGTEAWPGSLVPVDQSACLFLDNISWNDLYQSSTWQTRLTPLFQEWQSRKG